MYWPSLSNAVKDYIYKCSICHSFDSKQPKEPLHSHDMPNKPWAKIGTDLFSCNDINYHITVDYHSGFWEVDALPDTTSHTVINKLKAHFTCHGIHDVCISDNGPQFSSEEFKAFSFSWQFEHKTSSPGYPQSNGKEEQAVKAANMLMKKAKKAGTDPYLLLLSHRNTPTQGLGSSPVQRLMSKRPTTLLPTIAKLLEPKLCVNVDKKLFACKQKQAYYYNKGAKDLVELKPGNVVQIVPIGSGVKEPVKAVEQLKVGTQAYELRTENGWVFICNHHHLLKSQEHFYSGFPVMSFTGMASSMM